MIRSSWKGDHYFPEAAVNKDVIQPAAAATRCVAGRAPRATTTSSWAMSGTPTRAGTTPSRRMPRSRSAVAWRSGRACRSFRRRCSLLSAVAAPTRESTVQPPPARHRGKTQLQRSPARSGWVPNPPLGRPLAQRFSDYRSSRCSQSAAGNTPRARAPADTRRRFRETPTGSHAHNPRATIRQTLDLQPMRTSGPPWSMAAKRLRKTV